MSERRGTSPTTRKPVRRRVQPTQPSQELQIEISEESSVSPVSVEIESDSENNITEVDSSPSKTKKKATLDEILKDLHDIKTAINEEISALQGLHTRVKGVRKLQSMRRKIENIEKKVPRLTKLKRVVKTSGNYGFSKPKVPSPELCKFLHLEDGETISRTDVTRAVCAYIHISDDETREEILRWESTMNPNRERNLQDPEDKNKILPDKTLSDLLDYEKYKQQVANKKVMVKRKQPDGTRKEIPLEEDGLYYTTIQRLLTPHLT